MKAKQSMVVEQMNNPRYDEKRSPKEEEYTYHVIKMTNLLADNVAIGGYLPRKEVQYWIDHGVNVTIQPVA